MDIFEAVNKYIQSGYSEDDAIPKVAQDIVLLKIGNSKYSKNITVKGGVVMHNISKDMRRATRDMDIDFIKYSLEDKSIREFIKELNNTNDGIKIKITGNIEPLHHQDIVEKLKSLLKFGITSTRFKDIFDFYYLINNENLDKDQLIKYIYILIFQDENMREHTIEDISKRLSSILNNSRFKSKINTANNNWLEMPIEEGT